MARRGSQFVTKRGLGVAAVAVVMVMGGLAYLLGVVAVERHRGFFAPVWGTAGRAVYLIQRDTVGFVWGMGWESFSPPAYAYVLSDLFSLRRLDPETGTVDVLEAFDGSPIAGRVTRHYRGRIFNMASARVSPGAEGRVEFVVRMNVPRQPRSESWALAGKWSAAAPSGARWTTEWAGTTAPDDAVLTNGVELMAVEGRESFPAGILAVGPEGDMRVLLENDDFDALYPDGVPPRQIAELSQRARIERVRDFTRVEAELRAKYARQGLGEGEAWLRAHDEMEELGYLPKSPRLVATLLDAPPPDVRVFDIPEDRFKVGLFRDIAAAVADPGAEVKTDTGTYLKYYDDETGLRLKDWRAAGNDRFVVRTGGRLYLLEVRRFDR